MKYVLTAAVAAAILVPTLARADFYIVQDSSTKKCTIGDQKPTVTTSVLVGDGKVYTTRQEAETGMKTVKVCAN